MSTPTRLTSNAVATHWRMTSENKFGEKEYAERRAIVCTFEQDLTSEYVDNMGVVFKPQLVIHYEDDGQPLPREGDYIAIGDYTNTGVSQHSYPGYVDNAVPVKTAKRHDCSLLGDLDDFEVAG